MVRLKIRSQFIAIKKVHLMAKSKDDDRRYGTITKPSPSHPWRGIHAVVDRSKNREDNYFNKDFFLDDEIAGKNPCGWGGFRCFVSNLRGK